MNEKLKKIQCLSGSTLKLLAMALMLIDHAGHVLFPHLTWMRAVGRIAFPIFAFFVAEGLHYTRSRPKYMLRLGIFALISEIPFNLAISRKALYPDAQNVMFTFLIAALTVTVFEALYKSKDPAYEIPKKILGIVAAALIPFLGIALSTDYNSYGVWLVMLFYFLRESRLAANLAAVGANFIWYSNTLSHHAALSFFPLMLYNGKKGAELKYLFYIFYPAHLLLLWAISYFGIL